MKLFSKNKKHLFLSVACSFSCLCLSAQVDSYAALELQQELSFWKQGANPAGAWLDNPLTFSDIAFNMDYENGNFHRPMEGKSIRTIGLKTEGVVLLKKHYLKGFFNYTNRNVNEEGYNTSFIDPYRGMPYGVVDLNHSDWKNQYYDMGVRWAYPGLLHKWNVGIDLNYHAHSAAKQRDVRADIRYMMLEVRPGITWSIKENHHIGAYLNYYSTKEEANNMNVNNYVSQEYYELNGLGNAVQGIGTGRTTNYTGDNFGAGIDYSWTKGSSELLISSAYNLKAEKAEASFSLPRKVGSVRHAIWDNHLKFYTRSSGNFGHLIKLDYIYSEIKGVEYITQRDNTQEQSGWQTIYAGVRSKYKKQNMGINYSLIAHRKGEYKWLAKMAISYLTLADVYLIPASEKKIDNWVAKATFKRNIMFSGASTPRLLLSAEAIVNKNSAGSYIYSGEHPTYITVTEIEQGDYNYLESDYWGVNLVANYSQSIQAESNLRWYISGYFNYLKTDNLDFNNRKKMGVTVGCIF
ncbi:MAG: hypothetical protein PHY71_01320 [Bacteroidaceae bacterium]|nr:hypothetical protein [Bacteroidaceae bacterium]